MRPNPRILVVDDERDLAELLSYNLRKRGFDVSVALDGREALHKASQQKPDIMLLDVMLPGLSGIEVAERLREDPSTADIPIVMLTARTSEHDELSGLSVGADDYISKPFSIEVVVARLEAVLRRAAAPVSDAKTLELGRIRLDMRTYEAWLGDEQLKFTRTEFKLLAALLASQGRVLTRRELIDRALGAGVTVTDRTIDVHVAAVRRKLADEAALIRTVRGVGYRAAPREEAVGADES